MNIIKFFLNFCRFNVVEEDVSAIEVDEAVVKEVEPIESTEEFVEKSLQDEAFNQEPVVEEIKPDVVEETPVVDKKIITDKDLEPLNTGNKATNERFQRLTDGYKEKEAEFNQLSQQFEQKQVELQQHQSSFDALQQLGFNDAESAQSLIEFSQYRNAIKSGDVNTFTAMLAQEIQQFELAIGKRVNLNVSGIDKYDDLRQRVDNQELTEQDALRLARLNALEERAGINQQLNYQQSNNEQQQEQAINQASQEIVRFKDYLQKNDPDFQKVVQVLQPHLDSIVGNLHPSQWLAAIETNYKLTKDAMLKSQPARTVISPLRANSAPSGKPVFKTGDELVSHELSDENW